MTPSGGWAYSQVSGSSPLAAAGLTVSLPGQFARPDGHCGRVRSTEATWTYEHFGPALLETGRSIEALRASLASGASEASPNERPRDGPRPVADRELPQSNMQTIRHVRSLIKYAPDLRFPLRTKHSRPPCLVAQSNLRSSRRLAFARSARRRRLGVAL